MELWQIFLFLVVVASAAMFFSVLAWTADYFLRKFFGRGIVPKDYYK